MPIPKPSSGETKGEFIDRCMGDDTMQQEYPDDDQRLAVCNRQYGSRIMRETRELRVLPCGVEMREHEGRKLFVGRPIVYNSWSEMISGMFRERIVPGAFDECLRENPDIIACVDHNVSKLLGRTASGTLRLKNDEEGIYCEVDRPDTSYANDLAESIKRGDIRGMSFVFSVDVGGDRWGNEDGVKTRDVTKATLYEVSFVVFPAYPETEAAMRSLNQHIKQTLGIKQRRINLLERE